MTTSRFPEPSFGDRLELIEERSAALRTAAEAADPKARIPGCPDWTVPDLVAHLGQVQRFWAATVAAGPALRPPVDVGGQGDAPAGDLLEWSVASTLLLLDALKAAGPDVSCWTWWADSGTPATAGSVARHQVQEAAVHARDAQEAAGAPEPLPAAIAVDAVDEFLHVGFGSMDGWPHAPARVRLVSEEGPAWTLILDETGASAVRGGPDGGPTVGATISGSAGDLLLGLYRRAPWDDGPLRVTGDAELVRQLVVWPPLG
ncbi:maleylpyruvate isomerase family mycothiol-dependent enzyme [Actinacidiphila acidipaludis]|uniref:Maleylpyruvate isomerase family mycothiol-dependent enzyme n=1 Tax=Actinacidiphila acidipaludis TaxID=2873382 RepID=A0ABS7Q3Z5_9ACTN|nr:maleylpyruvate isomerase family mycothiol-dependent enzyme [Streptomyces acidipaludis]MBY8877888.1 maleylpyruvate isomerase family mycothiol-dependent enzyme [Streptomyces acidipaludis]